jgi:hypothetical protein
MRDRKQLPGQHNIFGDYNGSPNVPEQIPGQINLLAALDQQEQDHKKEVLNNE